MKPEISLPHSQEASSGAYPEPRIFCLRPHTNDFRSILLSFSHSCL